MRKRIFYITLLLGLSIQASYAEGDDDQDKKGKKLVITAVDTLLQLEGDLSTEDTLVFEDYDDFLISDKGLAQASVIKTTCITKAPIQRLPIQTHLIQLIQLDQAESPDDPISTLEEEQFVNLYPNPSPVNAPVNVDVVGLNNPVISLYSLNGNLILEQREKEINTDRLKAGSYIVAVTDGNHSFTKRLIVY